MTTKKAIIDVYKTPGIIDRKNYEQLCIRSVKEPELRAQFSLGYLVAMFEEETLEQLQANTDRYNESNQHNEYNNNSRSYNSYNSYNRRWGGANETHLQDKLDALATRLNVNIRVFIGHIDICTNFLEVIGREFPIEEPTLILLIGCLGTQYAEEANQNELWKGEPCAVMAFNDLIHIYDSKIYGCEVSHKSVPNMMCDYDGSEKDYEKLAKEFSRNNTGILNEYEAQQALNQHDNELVKCCKTKLNRFSSVFLKNLRKRNCVEFTMEHLESKMRNLLKEDGSIDHEKLETRENYIFNLKDGISCREDGGCDISNPYEVSVKNAEAYNQRSSILNLYQTFIKFIEDKKDDADKEDVLLKQLQQLRPEEKPVVNYQQNGRTLLHMFAHYGYPRCLEYLIKKIDTLPLQVIDEDTGNIFLEELMLNGYNSEEEKLGVIIKVHEKYPELLDTDIPGRIDVTFIASSLHYVSILTFMIEKAKQILSTKKYTIGYNTSAYNNANLLFVACDNNFLVNKASYDIIKLLLGNGVDPNEGAIDTKGRNVDILDFYFEKNIAIISPKVIKEFCNYGYNHVFSIDSLVEDFNLLLKGGQKLIDYKQYWIQYYKKFESNSIDKPRETERLDSEILDLVDAVLLNLPAILRRNINTLEEAKKIISSKGKKTNKQIAANVARTHKRLRNNLNRVTRKISAPEKIPIKYEDIDKYIKSVGTKFTKEEKKAYREEGISVIQNKNTNALERLQKLENLLTTIQEEAAKRSAGGKRNRVTRKKRAT